MEPINKTEQKNIGVQQEHQSTLSEYPPSNTESDFKTEQPSMTSESMPTDAEQKLLNDEQFTPENSTEPSSKAIPEETSELVFFKPSKKTRRRKSCPKGCIRKTRCKLKKKRTSKKNSITSPPIELYGGKRRRRSKKSRK